ncbi:tetratricopeptide repeat protein [Streptomyces sp. 3MP-14]|uniref:Tetratricopeptide repeat protein n=1 Tax=Streptomyces mimosae TaxID=2586635 RepID=A0A5N6ABW1_9ACTN|nr:MULTISPECIES: BTAD domain-containing putative transcriptional regulator [Streptomyces]KAB8165735.1 tetratricopeptide repeat protein [Streptomyces mimosae]KAB8176124.1 tetratricopeptide repeat protein [Streptomyces sp. 3MP-14]
MVRTAARRPSEGTGMEFVVLGPMAIRRDGRALPVTGRLRRALLGMLLERANQAVSPEALAEVLWEDPADERVGARLHLQVHRLRTLLGDPERLTHGPEGYRLRVLPGELDAERFDAEVTEGLALVAEDPRRALALLRGALARWDGDTSAVPFADLDVPPLSGWAQRLAERRLAAQEACCEAQLTAGVGGRAGAGAGIGAGASAVAELAALVRQHPLRERLHELLMIALHREGRTGEALAAYRTARRHLVTELGLEPGAGLRELERRILAGEPVETARPEPQGPRPPVQLPSDIGGFVGRETELAWLDERLAAAARDAAQPVPVSVVAGTAGVGKTALVVHWAHRARGHFPDGQLYVDLRGYGPDQPVTPGDALAGFLRALGQEDAAVPDELAERAALFRSLLDGRRVLVVLDNARGTEQVRPLLPGGPGSLALVTSRDALGGLVAREGAGRLPLDRLPRADAHRLLAELLDAPARLAAEPASADALVERCARLPLALRITAELARSQPARSLAELVGELADRREALDVLDLDDDPSTALRAVFSWSYQRLAPEVAAVFRLLGLLPGQDADAHAIAALAGAPVRTTRRALDVLVRAHLVDPVAGGRRYQPHDLLRAYAAELAEAVDPPAARREALDRLLDYYLFTAGAALDAIVPFESYRRPTPPAWPGDAPPLNDRDHAQRWLAAERANLLEAARHGDARYVVALSTTLWRYLDIGGYTHELVAWCSAELAAARELDDLRAEADARGHLALAMGRHGRDNAAAVEHARRGIAAYERLGDRGAQGRLVNSLGILYAKSGELAGASEQFRRVLELNGPEGPWPLRRSALVNLSNCLSALGRWEEALGCLEEALAVCEAHDDRPHGANILLGMAENLQALGRVDAARDLALRALAQARETGFRGVESDVLGLLGTLCRAAGDLAAAISHQEAGLALCRELGDSQSLARRLNELADSRVAAGEPGEALRLHEEALAVATEGGNRREVAVSHAAIAAVQEARGRDAEARSHRLRALGLFEALGLPEAEELRAALASPVPQAPVPQAPGAPAAGPPVGSVG